MLFSKDCLLPHKHFFFVFNFKNHESSDKMNILYSTTWLHQTSHFIIFASGLLRGGEKIKHSTGSPQHHSLLVPHLPFLEIV